MKDEIKETKSLRLFKKIRWWKLPGRKDSKSLSQLEAMKSQGSIRITILRLKRIERLFALREIHIKILDNILKLILHFRFESDP